MADERTPEGGAPRPHRPPLRLARRSAPLGAAGRLGGEVAAARTPGRVVRSATRLTARPPPTPAAPEPASGGVARAPAAPSAPAAPPAPPTPAAGIPAGMCAPQAAWVPGGDADKAVEMSALPDADVDQRAKLQRSRGARILEGPATGHAEPLPKPESPAPDEPRAPPWVAGEPADPKSIPNLPVGPIQVNVPDVPDPSELSIPPMPGLGTAASEPTPKPSGGSRIGRAPAGSAHSTPAPDGPKAPPAPPSIMRTAAPTPAPTRPTPPPSASGGGSSSAGSSGGAPAGSSGGASGGSDGGAS